MTMSSKKAHHLLDNLTPEQAKTVLKRVCEKRDQLIETIREEVLSLLNEVEVETVANEVQAVLASIDREAIGERSGQVEYGYVEPAEAAHELLHERMKPFRNQLERFQALDLNEPEDQYLRGVLIGLYRSRSGMEVTDVLAEQPSELSSSLLSDWEVHVSREQRKETMYEFLVEHCSDWESWIEREFDL